MAGVRGGGSAHWEGAIVEEVGDLARVGVRRERGVRHHTPPVRD